MPSAMVIPGTPGKAQGQAQRKMRGFLRVCSLVCSAGLKPPADTSPPPLPLQEAEEVSMDSSAASGPRPPNNSPDMRGGAVGAFEVPWGATQQAPNPAPVSPAQVLPPVSLDASLADGPSVVAREGTPKAHQKLQPEAAQAFMSSESSEANGRGTTPGAPAKVETQTSDSTPYTSSEYDVFPSGRAALGMPEVDSATFSSSEFSPYKGLATVYGRPRGGVIPAGSPYDGPQALMFNSGDMSGRPATPHLEGQARLLASGELAVPGEGEGQEGSSGVGKVGAVGATPGKGGGAVSPAQVKSLVHALHSPLPEERLQAAVAIRKLSKTDSAGRKLFAEGGAVLKLFEMMQEQHPALVEAGVYAILVLAINEEVRWNVNGALVIPILLRLTRHPVFSIQEGATAMMFCLSGIDENKILIGNMGGIPVLMEVLVDGSGRMKRDVLRTLFNLSLLSINKTTLLQHRVVMPIVRLISLAPAHKLVEVAVSLLRNLATRDEGRDAIVAHHGIAVLAKVLEAGSAMSKEEAVSILLVLSTRNPAHRGLVWNANLMPLLRSLALSGTPRARARADELMLDLSEHCKAFAK